MKMTSLFHSNAFIRSPSTSKMQRLINPHNILTKSDIVTVSDHFTKNYRPQNTSIAGGLRVASSTDSERCHTVNIVTDDTDIYTLADLQRDNLPKHVAIILDGSRRWLKAHNKPLTYEPFFEANLVFAELCIKWGILTATSFVYSLKNLERGQEANDLIFGQLETFLEENMQKFVRKGIRIKVIGERRVLPQTLQSKITQVEEATIECRKLEFMLAVCYAGTRDIVQATKNICEKVNNGIIEIKAIDETLLESELWTRGSHAPRIDLVIRTGGRLRVSDYLMWQMAQAELYFSKLTAPEFYEHEFLQALRSFQRGERTFGK